MNNFGLELDVDGLSVEHLVNLLIYPAEDLLIEVPEVNYEQNADYGCRQLNSLFANIAHIIYAPFDNRNSAMYYIANYFFARPF